MSYPLFEDLVDSLEACVRQLVETAAYDDARKGEDPGLLETVETAKRVIARVKAG